MSLLSMLTDTCTIRRRTDTQSATTGGFSPTFTDAYTGVACAVQHLKRGGGGERFAEQRETAVTDYEVYFPYGTDVRFDDRILGTSGVLNGITAAVTSDPVDDSGRGTYWRVEAQSKRGGGTT